MDENKFEAERPRLRAVAYRMLGSVAEADDAVQEAWLRLNALQLNAASEPIDDLAAWLTTVVARIALNVLRARKRHRVPDALVDSLESGPSAEHAVLLHDTLGLALLVVLEKLAPAERVAFVLHDVFDVPFDRIASIVERTPEATRQLASRARRRVEAQRATPDADVAVQRSVLDAFLAAAHAGDLQRLVGVLDPSVLLRAHMEMGDWLEVTGAEEVARRSQSFSRTGLERLPILINGAPGILCRLDGAYVSLMSFIVRGARIVEIDILRDLTHVDLTRVDLHRLGLPPHSPR